MEVDDPLPLLVGFARALREAGLPVGSGEMVTYAQTMTRLDPADLLDLYWGGRTTLVGRRDQLATYHDVFLRYFLEDGREDPPPPFAPQQRAEARAALNVPEVRPPVEGERQRESAAVLGLVGAAAEVLRSKSFDACTPAELLALHRIMRRIRLAPPRRRTRRYDRSARGRIPDLRRTVRETMWSRGEPVPLRRRERRLKVRRLVLVLDVSGSMADYSRNLLQFAHSTLRAAGRVEVFCFGTRLSRITKELAHRRPDQALARAARAVFDWDGGTRIGDSLDTLVRDWGTRGALRGAIVVICSDGLDRGDPALLAQAMQRLRRQAHRIVWMNPHKGDARQFTASTLGMLVAAPYVDAVLSGHSLRSLEEFAELLPGLG